MSLSAHEITWLLEHLSPLAVSARVRNVHDDTGASSTGNGIKLVHGVILTLRVPGENLILRISTHPDASRMALLTTRPTAPPRPSGFVQLLRKRLVGAELVALEQVPDDRIVYLRFLRYHRDEETEEPRQQQYVLACELTGPSANVLLLDLSDESTDHSVARTRVLGTLEPQLHRAREYEPRPPLPSAHRAGSVRLQLRTHAGENPDAHAISAAVEEYYEQELKEHARTRRWRRLNRAVKREYKRAARLAQGLEGDLARAENAQKYKEYGDLLAARFNQLARGMHEITVDNFYDEMNPVSIPLDPARSPRENVDRYYRKYKKYRDAVDGIETRYTETLIRVDELDEVRQQIRAAREGESPLESLEARAIALDVDLTPARQKQTKKRERARLPYRAFTSATGVPIFVGKTSKDNDKLTFRVANGNDLWLHAAGVPGSHVIVRLQKNKGVDEETLLDAATLAAQYSKASTGNVIEVHYTQQKYVRKVKGGPPGLVTMAGSKTIAIRIEPDRLARLNTNAGD